MSDKKTIEIDLSCAPFSQLTANRIHAQTIDATHADIILRNVDVRVFPRLIVDYGTIYETLCEVAKEYRELRAAMLSVGEHGELQPLPLGQSPTNVTEIAAAKPSFIPTAHENKSIKERHEMWDIAGGPNRGPMPDDFMADENKQGDLPPHLQPSPGWIICADCTTYTREAESMNGLCFWCTPEGKAKAAEMACESKSIKEQRAEQAQALGYPVDPKTGFATSGMGADYHLVAEELKAKSVWLCSNHPPGSAVEVKKGEACYCGRSE
jgi:hypothetical protein